MSKNVEQAVIETLAYFSVADFPLTKEELYRYLWRSPSVSFLDFSVALASMVQSGKVEEYIGMYCLPGEKELIEKRRQAVVYTDQKLRKAKKAVVFIRWLPFLRTVLVCNSVGREVAEPKSDIDVLIITEKNRIWIVRALANSILRLFGLRTYKNREADRLCLSFFIDTDRLNLYPWRAVDEDVHFAYWLHQMIPVYDPENYYTKLLNANTWVNDLLPHRQKSVLPPENKMGKVGNAIKKFFEIAWKGLYGDMVEKQAKEMQWMKIKISIKEKANQPDNGIVLQQGILKFHEHDARKSYRDAWLKKIQALYARTS